jgi:hypothetical protein
VRSSLFENNVFLVGQHMAQYGSPAMRPGPCPCVCPHRPCTRSLTRPTTKRSSSASSAIPNGPRSAFGLDDLGASEEYRTNAGRVAARATLIPVIHATPRSCRWPTAGSKAGPPPDRRAQWLHRGVAGLQPRPDRHHARRRHHLIRRRPRPQPRQRLNPGSQLPRSFGWRSGPGLSGPFMRRRQGKGWGNSRPSSMKQPTGPRSQRPKTSSQRKPGQSQYFRCAFKRARGGDGCPAFARCC